MNLLEEERIDAIAKAVNSRVEELQEIAQEHRHQSTMGSQ